MEKLQHCIICDNPFRIKTKIGMSNSSINLSYPLRKRNSVTCTHKCSVVYNHTRDKKIYIPIYKEKMKRFLMFIEAQNGN